MAVWYHLTLICCIAINFGLIVFNTITMVRGYRRLQHATQLDVLLANICGRAALHQNAPVWRAWAETMGDLQVEVRSKRNWPT